MNTMLRIEGDPQADAMYIWLSEEQPAAYSKEFSDTIVGDFNSDGVLVGIDLQQVSLLHQPSVEGSSAVAMSWKNFGAQVTLAGIDS